VPLFSFPYIGMHPRPLTQESSLPPKDEVAPFGFRKFRVLLGNIRGAEPSSLEIKVLPLELLSE